MKEAPHSPSLEVGCCTSVSNVFQGLIYFVHGQMLQHASQIWNLERMGVIDFEGLINSSIYGMYISLYVLVI